MRVLLKAVMLGCLLLPGCDLNSENVRVFSYSFEFSKEAFGWTGDFSDYPVNDSLGYELLFKHDFLPESISKTRKALKLSGNNHNKDLFMFIKRKVSGLMPNTTYNVLFNIRLASNAPTGVLVPGDSPGENVYLKAGASTVEPLKIASAGKYAMNINKGNHATGGTNMQLVGNIGITSTTTNYTEVYRNNNSTSPFQITTSDTGEVWIIIGTDSSFKGTTTLYYTSIDILFNEVN